MSISIINPITHDLIQKAYSYSEYTDLISHLFEEGRTTNNDNDESMLAYTKLNMQRSSRWDKRAVLNEELTSILKGYSRKMIWLVLTEGWCGDASQIIPFFHKMAELSPAIQLKLILRDEHPEVMDEFLTNGTSRAIPKLIAIDEETLEIVGSWGPRPHAIQDTYMANIRNPEFDNEEAKKQLHLWYAKDKGFSLQEEMKVLLHEWKDK